MTAPVLEPERYPVLPPELLRHCRVVPNRLAALDLWPKDAVIAEVGVALGGFTAEILRACQPRRFLAIDRFDLHELPVLWGVPTTEHFGGRTHEAFYRDRFAAQIASGEVQILKGDSAEVISGLPDGSVDLFYVDADHTYAGVVRDLNAIRPKVKPDGWIIMNDYIPAEIGGSNEPYGVIQATNEFMVAHGWEMVYFALAHAMYCDVGLRRAGAAPLVTAETERVHALEQEVRALRASTSGGSPLRYARPDACCASGLEWVNFLHPQACPRKSGEHGGGATAPEALSQRTAIRGNSPRTRSGPSRSGW